MVKLIDEIIEFEDVIKSDDSVEHFTAADIRDMYFRRICAKILDIIYKYHPNNEIKTIIIPSDMVNVVIDNKRFHIQTNLKLDIVIGKFYGMDLMIGSELSKGQIVLKPNTKLIRLLKLEQIGETEQDIEILNSINIENTLHFYY